MEVKEFTDARWALANSTENSVEAQGINGKVQEEDDEDEEEALSLCDLPLINQSRKENGEYSTPNETDYQQDFDFCSLSKESEMCTADEVFYQGQILPLRRVMCSTTSIRRSESMDSGFTSSRSSSISSHHSSTSGSGTSAATADPKLQPRNRFHSHPSPSPRIHLPRNRNNNRNCTKTSYVWNVFRLGLVAAPPEIAIHDLKNRGSSNTNCKNRSNTNSNSEKKKNKPWDFLGGSCKCSFDAVDTVPSEVVIRRSASDSEREMKASTAEEENLVMMKSAKKRLYHHRTFEWLKQLSLERAADEP